MMYVEKNSVGGLSVGSDNFSYANTPSAPEATVGTEVARAMKEAGDCAQLAHEISMRLCGPRPVDNAQSAQVQDVSLRHQLRTLADETGITADILRHILRSL